MPDAWRVNTEMKIMFIQQSTLLLIYGIVIVVMKWIGYSFINSRTTKDQEFLSFTLTDKCINPILHNYILLS